MWVKTIFKIDFSFCADGTKKLAYVGTNGYFMYEIKLSQLLGSEEWLENPTLPHVRGWFIWRNKASNMSYFLAISSFVDII